MPRNGMITPSVVGVGEDLGSTCVIDRDDITLQILLKIEGVKGVNGVRGIPVLHSDGGTRFVIQIDQQVTTPSLADDLGSIQSVAMVSPVDGLVSADSVGVVGKFDHRVGFLHLLELTAVPRQGVAVEGFGVTYGVVGACENT